VATFQSSHTVVSRLNRKVFGDPYVYSYWWELYVDSERQWTQQVAEVFNEDGKLTVEKSVYLLASHLKKPNDCMSVDKVPVYVRSFITQDNRTQILAESWKPGISRVVEFPDQNRAAFLLPNDQVVPTEASIAVKVSNPWSVQISQYPAAGRVFGHHTAAATSSFNFELLQTHTNFGSYVGNGPASLRFQTRVDVQAPAQSQHVQLGQRDKPDLLLTEPKIQFTQPVSIVPPTATHHVPPTSDVPVRFRFDGWVFGQQRVNDEPDAKQASWYARPKILNNRPDPPLNPPTGAPQLACMPYAWTDIDRDVAPATPTPGTSTGVG
jgi:hypothetical protein